VLTVISLPRATSPIDTERQDGTATVTWRASWFRSAASGHRRQGRGRGSSNGGLTLP
jgi:hypothetical protein